MSVLSTSRFPEAAWANWAANVITSPNFAEFNSCQSKYGLQELLCFFSCVEEQGVAPGRKSGSCPKGCKHVRAARRLVIPDHADIVRHAFGSRWRKLPPPDPAYRSLV
jgi:hypothetical protein